jgi:hypothetical protein
LAPIQGESLRPELADVLRLGRRLVRMTVATARADEAPTPARLLRVGQANERGAATRRHGPPLERALEIDMVIEGPPLAHHRQ